MSPNACKWHLGTRVRFVGTRNRGRIQIEYRDPEDLDSLLRHAAPRLTSPREASAARRVEAEISHGSAHCAQQRRVRAAIRPGSCRARVVLPIWLDPCRAVSGQRVLDPRIAVTLCVDAADLLVPPLAIWPIWRSTWPSSLSWAPWWSGRLAPGALPRSGRPAVVGGGLFHALWNSGSIVPTIGASAGVAGLIGVVTVGGWGGLLAGGLWLAAQVIGALAQGPAGAGPRRGVASSSCRSSR